MTRLALDPPPGDFATLTAALLDEVSKQAANSPRRRIIYPFHKSESEPLHRMLNAIEPGSYVRPHRHLDPPKAEAWILLRGACIFFIFEDDGRVRERIRVSPDGVFGVDLVPGVYHSFAALAPGTVVYEVKTGPYTAANDKSFAPWAPAENTEAAVQYLAGLLCPSENS